MTHGNSDKSDKQKENLRKTASELKRVELSVREFLLRKNIIIQNTTWKGVKYFVIIQKLRQFLKEMFVNMLPR